MKKTGLLICVLFVLVYAFEIKGVLGLNGQTYAKTIENSTVSYSGSGWGTHIGAGVGIDITPGCLPVVMGIETGLWVQNTSYTWKILGIEEQHNYSNIAVPLVPKITLKPPTAGFSLSFGMGPLVFSNTSGRKKVRFNEGSWVEEDIPKEELRTFLCWRFQGELGIKVAPILFLSPYFIFQPNLTADDPDTDVKESRNSVLFGLGLVFRI